MSNHRKIISERGGIRPLARALGHRNPTTVQGWFARDKIPDERIAAVLDVSPAATESAAA